MWKFLNAEKQFYTREASCWNFGPFAVSMHKAIGIAIYPFLKSMNHFSVLSFIVSTKEKREPTVCPTLLKV